MQVMIDLQLEEMRISFESNRKQKKKSKDKFKTRIQTSDKKLCFTLLARKQWLAWDLVTDKVFLMFDASALRKKGKLI